jgi:hypothetical protein
MPKVSELRTRSVVNDVGTAADGMPSILPAPYQTHHSPQTAKVLRTDEGDEVQQCFPVLSIRHTLDCGQFRRASTRSLQLNRAERHRCNRSAFHGEPGLCHDDWPSEDGRMHVGVAATHQALTKLGSFQDTLLLHAFDCFNGAAKTCCQILAANEALSRCGV